MSKTVAGVFTVPEGDELLWSAVGVGMAFIVPALQKKIGGSQYASLAPEITEFVGAVTNMAIATGVGKFVSPERGNAVAIGAVGTAVLKEAVLLRKVGIGKGRRHCKRGARILAGCVGACGLGYDRHLRAD